MEHLNIVLLGKTGHGKSATGNTILREDRFYVGKDLTSCTKMVERYKCQINNCMVQVFDTPGPFDTEYVNGSSVNADIAKTCPLMESMIATASKDDGVHAFFLVLAIGTRLTKEEITTIETLEEIFGKNVFSEFGVLVFSHGESLGMPFSDWYSKQEEALKLLKAKFTDRVVVTTNVDEFSGSRMTARMDMFKEAQRLKKKNKKAYRLENYKSSQISRNYLLVKSKKEDLEADFLRKMEDLEEEIKNCKLNNQKANHYFRKINELRGEITYASNGTNLLKDIYDQVNRLQILVEKNFAVYFQIKIKGLEEEIKKNGKLKTDKANHFFRIINELRGEIKNACNGTDVLNVVHGQVDKLQTLVESKISNCTIF